jgi:flagellar motor switch protein FliN/FliY
MAHQDEQANLTYLSDINVEVVTEMGRLKMPLSDTKKMQVGSVIKLEKLAGEAFDIHINKAPFGEGEIVVVSNTMACRITRLKTPIEYQEDQQ